MSSSLNILPNNSVAFSVVAKEQRDTKEVSAKVSYAVEKLPVKRKEHLAKLLQSDGCLLVDHGTHLKGTVPKISGIASGDCLGRGITGSIEIYKKDPTFVIKKFPEWHLRKASNEFSIGAQLDHPNINKIYAMITSQDNTEKTRYALILDRIEGPTLCDSKKLEFTGKDLIVLVKQIKSYSLYLFEQSICPHDLNPRNIFITKDNQIKLIDFDSWERGTQLHEIAAQILFCAMNVLQKLVSHSVLKESEEIGFPQGQIREFSLCHTITSLVNLLTCNKQERRFDFSQFKESPYHQTIRVLRRYLYWSTKTQLKEFISDYFDRVIKQINPK